MADRLECEVAIVGAGLAGLVAAIELESKGVEVAVIEALEEVGGRTRSREFAGRVVELGATFFSRRQWRINRLARELGLTIQPTGLWGGRIRWNSPRPASGPIPRFGASDMRGLVQAGLAARRLARAIDPDRPWEGARAAELDRVSVADWIERLRLRGTARWLLEMAIGGYASRPVQKLSLLQYLWWVSRYGGNLPALRTGNSHYLAEGAQQIALRICDRLSRPPLLGTAIDEIAQDGSVVELACSGELACRARTAIVTSPLAALDRIRFSPPLPDDLAECYERLESGHITKLGAVTLAPPGGAHRSVIGGEPLAWTMRLGSELIGYGLHPAAGRDDGELLALLGRDYGLQAGQVCGEVVDWSREPYARGSYVAFAPGQISSLAERLRRPHGLVHFAGAERSSMPQQMEGALESGAHAAAAARRVLAERGTAVAVR
jgi:monoamine oxidase